jgi:hypothetical protein
VSFACKVFPSFRRAVVILPHRNQYVQTLIDGNIDSPLESCGAIRRADDDLPDSTKIAKNTLPSINHCDPAML